MIEFGKSLRTAREAKGLSLSQVANMTHMLIQIVEGLEKEDFSQIVAPIYGRGFVKLYCEAVGLEPKPFIDEFMALYNNPKAKSPKSEPTPPAPTPAPPPPPFGDASDEGKPTPPIPSEFNFETAAPKAPSRFAAPMPIDDDAHPFPLLNGRLLAIIGGGIVILLLLVLGLRALYHATTGEAVRNDSETAIETTPTEAAAEEASRTPLPVKAFYAD